VAGQPVKVIEPSNVTTTPAAAAVSAPQKK
jgi:hypothetical protein